MPDEPKRSLFGEADAKSVEDLKPLGLMDILSGVFSEPVDLFKRLSKKPQWVGAMAVLTVMALLLTVAWAYRVDAVEFTRMQLERAMAQMPQLSQAQMAQMDANAEMGAKFVGPFAAISVLFMTPIAIFICGLIWWGVGLVSQEDKNWRPTYAHGLAVATAPSLVAVPYYLIGALMAILKPVGTLRADQIVPSSLGFWLQTDNPKLSIMYGKIDIFLLAGYALLFLAARHTLRAKPWGAALCVALSLAMSIVGILLAK